MSGARLAYGFALGMLATVNPCGFALLPAYLSYYLGMTDDEPEGAHSHMGTAVLRSLRVSIAMTLGFLVVFAPIGLIWSSISGSVGRYLPWVTIGFGVLLVVLGVAMLGGFSPVVRIPKLQTTKGNGEFASMLVFGVSYAVASLSCTMPLFVAVMSSTLNESFAAGALTFLFYGLGMGALVGALTLAVALARHGMIRTLHRVLPMMGRISGGLIVIAGVFVVYYGWSETLSPEQSGGAVAEWLTARQSDLSNWIQNDIGSTRLGLILGIVIVGATAVALILRGRGGPSPRSGSETLPDPDPPL